MKKEYQLIELYCTICQIYSTTNYLKSQRQSNNFCPKFTDEECITIYLWGLKEQKFDTKKVYDFTKNYLYEYFPSLPSYQAFNKRINFLSDDFIFIANYLMNKSEIDLSNKNFIIDSMPIILASEKRSSSAKTCKDICDKGFCSSKNIFYYGVKLHALCQSKKGTIPSITQLCISKASENDLPVGKRILEDVRNIDLFADKMYKDLAWELRIKANNNLKVYTPYKKYKGQNELTSFEKLFSKAVSKIRQPIESLFNWLLEKTNIQKASKVRSSSGLISFIFARISSVLI